MEGGHIFWKAGASITQAGPQKPGTDAAVKAHAFGNVFDIRVHGLGQVGHGIDE